MSYWSDWRERTWQCPGCGWTGPGRALGTEPFDALMELWCPTGDLKFGFLSYPSDPQTREAADRGVLEAAVMAHAARLRDSAATELHDARCTGLPDLTNRDLTFTLVLVGGATWSEPTWLTVQHNGQESYREPSGFEWWQEILVVIDQLLDAYGDRVRWIDPDQAGIELLGDSLSAFGHIQDYLHKRGVTPPQGPWAR